jgi:hypothetical protein
MHFPHETPRLLRCCCEFLIKVTDSSCVLAPHPHKIIKGEHQHQHREDETDNLVNGKGERQLHQSLPKRHRPDKNEDECEQSESEEQIPSCDRILQHPRRSRRPRTLFHGPV